MRFVPIAVVSGALFGVLAIATAFAQYPPPAEPVEIVVSNPNPGVGETITVTVTINQDDQAASMSGAGFALLSTTVNNGTTSATLLQAGNNCTAEISGGSGATVDPEAFVTDENGSATLSVYTGTKDAVLTLGVTCDVGSAQVLITVGDGDDGDDGDDGESPGPNDGESPGPPSTGSGASTNDGGVSPMVWLGGAAMVLAVAGIAGYRTAMRKRAS